MQLAKNFWPALRRIRRYFYYEAKITHKKDITKKEAIKLYLEHTGNLHVAHNKLEFILQQYRDRVEPVFSERAIRKDRQVRKEQKDWNRRDYNDYLRSAKWRKIRKEVFDLYKGLCNSCGTDLSPVGTRFDVHHKTYERLFNEDLSDLELLCPGCHSDKHPEKKKRH